MASNSHLTSTNSLSNILPSIISIELYPPLYFSPVNQPYMSNVISKTKKIIRIKTPTKGKKKAMAACYSFLDFSFVSPTKWLKPGPVAYENSSIMTIPILPISDCNIVMNQGKVKDPPICELPPDGGLIATQSSDIVIEMSPDHTKTMVGVLPLRPIKPLANGYKCANTQKLKNTPPRSLLHCGMVLYIVRLTPTAMAIKFIIMMVMGGIISEVHFTM